MGKSVEANGTVGNITKLFEAAKKKGLPVFISPHCQWGGIVAGQFRSAHQRHGLLLIAALVVVLFIDAVPTAE